MKEKFTLKNIAIVLVSLIAISAVKVYIGQQRDISAQEDFKAYVLNLKMQQDFALFDYCLGLGIREAGRTVEQINLELRQKLNEYSRKMSSGRSRPTRGKVAGFYVFLKKDLEDAYQKFKNAEIPDIPKSELNTNNIDRMYAGF